MTRDDEPVTSNIVFPPVHKSRTKIDRRAGLLRAITSSGILSILLILTLIMTLPQTTLSLGGLVVYASIVALGMFLFLLLIRYFTVLGFAFRFHAKYSGEEQSDFAPFVSIIVPAYNEAKILRASVESLLQLDYDNFEIVIVNDGSTDETAHVGESLVGYHRGRSSRVNVSLINKPNEGKSSALNLGIHYSKAEFVLCMDGDSYLSPDTLKMAMRHFVDPAAGAVAGNVKVQNRNKILTTLQALEYVEGLNMLRAAQSTLGIVNIVPGPIGVFRSDAIKSAGWYSDDTYAEDADLTLKIRSAGWKVIYEPNAISYTEAPQTIEQLLKQRYRWTRGILQSIRKHKHQLFDPTPDVGNALVLWTLFFESIIWPTMNIFANLFFIVIAVVYGLSSTIALWWAAIMLLEIMTALYCVATEREEFRLVGYAWLYRVFFILLIDITKAAATVEEFFGVPMTWGKLERVGVVKS